MVCCCFSFKLNTDSFIRSIYHNSVRILLKLFLGIQLFGKENDNFK